MDVSKPAKLGKIYPQKTVLHRLPIKMFYTWKNKYITEIKKTEKPTKFSLHSGYCTCTYNVPSVYKYYERFVRALVCIDIKDINDKPYTIKKNCLGLEVFIVVHF